MKVCCLHFNDDDYVVTSMGNWRILKKDAIPSQNIPKRLFEKPKMTRTLGRNNCSSLSISSSPACSNSSCSDFTIVSDACNTLSAFNNPQYLTVEEPNESSDDAMEIEIQSERGVKQKTNEDKNPKMYSITTQTDMTD